MNYQDYESPDPNMKLRDLEIKQKILKDRILLIGNNMIEIKEEHSKKIIELKKDLEILKQSMERIGKFLESISEEFSKFATKDDLEILSKQSKIFEKILE